MPQLSFLPDSRAVDPNLFALKWDQIFEVLAGIVILAFFLERGLAPLFESQAWLAYEHRQKEQGKGDFKPLIAFIIGAVVCIGFQFDFLAVVLSRDKSTYFGALLTGAVVAGGAKGALKLFHGVLGMYTDSYKQAKDQIRALPAIKPKG